MDVDNNKWEGEQEVIPTSEEMKNIKIRVKILDTEGNMDTFKADKVSDVKIVAYSDD